MNEDMQSLVDRWHACNQLFARPDTTGGDRALAFDDRALLWQRLGELAKHTPGGELGRLFAVACESAGAFDQQSAAMVRFAYGVPTMLPHTMASLLGFDERTCDACGRAWQSSHEGRCQQCPVILVGAPGTTGEPIPGGPDA